MARVKSQAAVIAALLAAAAGPSGCAHQRVRGAQTPPAQAQSASGGPAGAAVPPGEPDVREASLHVIGDVKAVYFGFDSSDLSAESGAVLRQNAEWLKNHLEAKAQAAGYCDERGTVEYNLALGQRRAQAVKRYYRMLGVPEGRIATISYGKEKPVCGEPDETCWRRNRRVDTLVAFPEAVSQAGEGKGRP